MLLKSEFHQPIQALKILWKLERLTFFIPRIIPCYRQVLRCKQLLQGVHVREGTWLDCRIMCFFFMVFEKVFCNFNSMLI